MPLSGAHGPIWVRTCSLANAESSLEQGRASNVNLTPGRRSADRGTVVVPVCCLPLCIFLYVSQALRTESNADMLSATNEFMSPRKPHPSPPIYEFTASSGVHASQPNRILRWSPFREQAETKRGPVDPKHWLKEGLVPSNSLLVCTLPPVPLGATPPASLRVPVHKITLLACS